MIGWIRNQYVIPSYSDLCQNRVELIRAELATWVADPVSNGYDFSINFGNCVVTRNLASLVPAKIRYGRGVNEHFDGWSLVQSALANVSQGLDIHNIDIYTTQLMTALQVHKAKELNKSPDIPVAERRFFDQLQLPFPSVRRIAISRSLRARLGFDFENISSKLSLEFVDIDLDSSVVDRVRIVSSSMLVISDQVELIQLSSVLSVRTIAVLPKDDWYLYGPYGGQNWVFDSDSSIGAVSEFLLDRIFEIFRIAKPDHLIQKNEFTDFQYAKSRIRNGDDGGGIHYESKLSLDEVTSCRRVLYSDMARSAFCGWIPKIEQNQLENPIRYAHTLRVLQQDLEQGGALSKELEVQLTEVRRLISVLEKLPSKKLMSFDQKIEFLESSKRISLSCQKLVEANPGKLWSGVLEIISLAQNELPESRLDDCLYRSREHLDEGIRLINFIQKRAELWIRECRPRVVPVLAESV